MATNLDNLDGIQNFISSADIEGYRSVPYVPMGCYADETKKVRFKQDQLKKDWNILLKNEKDEKEKNKLKALRSTESLCLALNHQFLPIGKSGVTFSFGIDLGQVDESTLRKTYGISDRAIKVVHPYLKTTSVIELKNVLGKQPVTIPPDVLKEFEAKYMAYYIDKTAAKFDNTPVENTQSKAKTFADLPQSNQSVLVSVLWQYGVNTKIKWIHDIFSAGRIDNWQKVKEILLQQKEYVHRRKKEANIIMVSSDIKNN
ncbi:MAG: pesticin C-terminus-like muramidase [Bacteroidia bacterium]